MGDAVHLFVGETLKVANKRISGASSGKRKQFVPEVSPASTGSHFTLVGKLQRKQSSPDSLFRMAEEGSSKPELLYPRRAEPEIKVEYLPN